MAQAAVLLLLAVVGCPLASAARHRQTGAGSKAYGSKVCCADADDPEQCALAARLPYQLEKTANGSTRMKCPNHLPTRTSGGCSFDNCVGPIGVDCEGVPKSIDFGVLGSIDMNLVKPINNGDGTSTIKTAVGSILHDLCCIEHPAGAFCGSFNYPIGATINLLGNTDNGCECLMEWRKAAWNLLRGRYWLATVSNAQQSSDLTYDSSLSRRSWLPVSSGTTYEGPSTWGLTERRSTASLCAPTGTKLDCPKNDENCKTGCIFSCTKATRRRYAPARAGDADYCCSKEFKSVYWGLEGTRYGTCA